MVSTKAVLDGVCSFLYFIAVCMDRYLCAMSEPPLKKVKLHNLECLSKRQDCFTCECITEERMSCMWPKLRQLLNLKPWSLIFFIQLGNSTRGELRISDLRAFHCCFRRPSSFNLRNHPLGRMGFNFGPVSCRMQS